MRRCARILAWFLLGGMVGAFIGALGGLMDRGSMMILMPSGSSFWAIFGAFFGSIAGAMYGAFSKSPPTGAHFTSSEEFIEESETSNQKQL